MNHTPEIVKMAINGNVLDTLVAEDLPANGGGQLGYKQGTDEELCAFVDMLHGNISGPYRITLSNSREPKRRGRKSNAENRRPEDKPFQYVLRGIAGAPAAPQPVGAAPPVASNATVPLELAKESAANAVRNELLEARQKELEEELAAIDAELGEAEEELEEADSALNATPPPPPRPWWESEAVGTALINLAKPLGEALAMKLRGPVNAAPPVKPANVAPADPSVTDEERRVLAAYRNACAQHGADMVSGHLGEFLTTYAPTAPEPEYAHNGNGQG